MATAPKRRPITDAEYARLTPQQRIALGLDEASNGAPPDFGGTVLLNPNNLRPLADTDSGLEPTRLPNGTNFHRGNFSGAMPRDVSNPSSSQLTAPTMRTVGANMSSPANTPNIQTAPVFSPDGTLGDIPVEQLPAALKAGFKPGVTMKSSDGKLGVIPSDRVQQASQSGLQVVPFHEQETQHPGFWNSLGADLKAMVPTMPSSFSEAANDAGKRVLSVSTMGLSDLPAVMQSAQQRYKAGHGLAYTATAAEAEGLGANVRGMEKSADEGDVAGVAGHLVAAAAPYVAGEVAKTAAVSDTAQAAADRAVAAAKNVTPKQAATVAGTATGAIIGKGVTSAYFGSKFGHVAEMLLGPERANLPIFQKAASLDEAADALAETIARDRAAQTQAGALGNLPATGAKPVAQTGEALATIPGRKPAAALGDIPATTAQPAEALATKPVSTDLTPEAKATSSAPKFTVQDRAAAKSLLEDALKTHTGDVIDQMVPGKNAAVKSQVDFYLKKGDVANAEAALDKGAKAWKNIEFDRQATTQATTESRAGNLPQDMSVVQRAQQLKEQMMADAGTNKPAWQALDRQPVPTTNEIRARVQREASAPKPGTRADLMEDKGIDQQWQWHLDRHGWAAESEARREFIARNSTGMTKGELGKRFAAGQSGSGAQTAAQPASASGTGADDLVDILQKSLEQVRKPKAQQ